MTQTQRLAEFTVEDIALDPKEVAERLNKDCRTYSHKYYVRGAWQIQNQVYFILLPKPPERADEEYVLAPMPDISTSGLEGTLSDRWGAGFDPIAAIHLGEESYIGVFAKAPEK